MSSRFINNFDRVRGIVNQAIIEAIASSLEYILEQSKEIVPFRDGILESSGSTDIDSRELKGTVFYDTPYAIRLHEHPEYDFQGKGEGKWLEKTIEENREVIQRIIHDILRRGFR